MKNIELINQNSTLVNNLADTEDKLAALVAQNLLLQEQLGANKAGRTDGDATMEDKGPAAIRGGGGKDAAMGDAGPDIIQGGEGDQESGSECPEGWTEFFCAAETHWKWPVTNPQNPRSVREPPPGHSLNIYTMTNSEAYGYATKDMLLGEAGTVAFYKYVSEICEEQSTWEAKAESAIKKDRQTGKSPNDEACRCYLLDTNKGLWILTQQELANLNPSSTPQDIWLITQKGYCSGIEAGIAQDTMSA